MPEFPSLCSAARRPFPWRTDPQNCFRLDLRCDLVVTQPDRPRGRGLELALSPVKQRALSWALPVSQPDKIKNNEQFRNQLAAIQPDAIIVGRIRTHYSSVDARSPSAGKSQLARVTAAKNRGAAPVQWAIAHGETATGVTTMRIDAGLKYR